MATKKTTRAKGKTSGKTKTHLKSSRTFPCPNPNRPLSLEAIIREMQRDEKFAQFIRGLLCDSRSEDEEKAEEAQECLASYYQPTSTELIALCIPVDVQDSYRACTDPAVNLLIAIPAKVFARKQSWR